MVAHSMLNIDRTIKKGFFWRDGSVGKRPKGNHAYDGLTILVNFMIPAYPASLASLLYPGYRDDLNWRYIHCC